MNSWDLKMADTFTTGKYRMKMEMAVTWNMKKVYDIKSAVWVVILPPSHWLRRRMTATLITMMMTRRWTTMTCPDTSLTQIC